MTRELVPPSELSARHLRCLSALNCSDQPQCTTYHLLYVFEQAFPVCFLSPLIINSTSYGACIMHACCDDVCLQLIYCVLLLLLLFAPVTPETSLGPHNSLAQINVSNLSSVGRWDTFKQEVQEGVFRRTSLYACFQRKFYFGEVIQKHSKFPLSSIHIIGQPANSIFLCYKYRGGKPGYSGTTNHRCFLYQTALVCFKFQSRPQITACGDVQTGRR